MPPQRDSGRGGRKKVRQPAPMKIRPQESTDNEQTDPGATFGSDTVVSSSSQSEANHVESFPSYRSTDPESIIALPKKTSTPRRKASPSVTARKSESLTRKLSQTWSAVARSPSRESQTRPSFEARKSRESVSKMGGAVVERKSVSGNSPPNSSIQNYAHQKILERNQSILENESGQKDPPNLSPRPSGSRRPSNAPSPRNSADSLKLERIRSESTPRTNGLRTRDSSISRNLAKIYTGVTTSDEYQPDVMGSTDVGDETMQPLNPEDEQPEDLAPVTPAEPETRMDVAAPNLQADMDLPSGLFMLQPFKLNVAGICDANTKNYFPLQERISLLESKLIDAGMEYQKLMDENRNLRMHHRTLDESIRALELVARDQVVFENLKLNYSLVSSELAEVKQIIQELRLFGWETLPQRLLMECQRAHDIVDRITEERDEAWHEHSAARNIANEALKEVKVLQRALEDHKKLTEKLAKREQEVKETYTEALKRLNDEWQEKVLLRHNRDKRRQQHMAFMLAEQKEMLDGDLADSDLHDVVFRANLVYRYPELNECTDSVTNVAGKSVGQPNDLNSDQNWQVSSKISKATADRILNRASRETARGSSETKMSTRSRSTTRYSDFVQLRQKVWSDELSDLPLDEPSDPERQAWRMFRLQLRAKYDGKVAENKKLLYRNRELESELQQYRATHLTSQQKERKIEELTQENKLLVEHYLSEMVLRRKYLNMLEDLRGKIRVYCRIRLECDKTVTPVVLTGDDYTALVKVPRGLRIFQFNRVFDQASRQEEVFEEFQNSVHSAIDGYNVSIFAYGEGKAGKTHTMTGEHDRFGLVPRMFQALFARLEDSLFTSKFHWTVTMMMFDLTSDGKAIDLLAEHTECQESELKYENRGNVVSLAGMTKRTIGCPTDMIDQYFRGINKHKAVDYQMGNSNRFHTIVIVPLVVTNKLSKVTRYGKFTLVRLGDCQKMVEKSSSDEESRDSQPPTDSLAALGDVITSLALGQSEVPYKNSKLTMLLQDALGGNSKTSVIAHIRCTADHLDQTIDTLNYASRLRVIKNHAGVVSNDEQVVKLKMMTEKLKHGEPVPC